MVLAFNTQTRFRDAAPLLLALVSFSALGFSHSRELINIHLYAAGHDHITRLLIGFTGTDPGRCHGCLSLLSAHQRWVIGGRSDGGILRIKIPRDNRIRDNACACHIAVAFNHVGTAFFGSAVLGAALPHLLAHFFPHGLHLFIRGSVDAVFGRWRFPLHPFH